jgi:hypothetical protein
VLLTQFKSKEELLDNQFTDLLLFPVKVANQAADVLFYDVGNLEPSEWERLSPLADLKGTIIAVSPRAVRRPDKVRQYGSAHRFMTEEGDRIQAIVVAGGGRSVLGTASLARSVADSTGWDVAGIVTGFGVTDLVVESLGGYFILPRLDRLRFEWDVVRDSDVRALCDILRTGPPRLRLLLGHSRGSLLISFVLKHMRAELGARAIRLRASRHPLFNKLAVVTLGAVVDIPTDTFAMETHQFLGALDLLGHLNSDCFPPLLGAITNAHEAIPGAGHHLNPIIPCSLSVADALRRAGVLRGGPDQDRAYAPRPARRARY